MPPRRTTVCAHPGCPHLTPGGSHCTAHRRERQRAQDRRRGTARQRGYDDTHERRAAEQIARQPWCSRCRQTRAQVHARRDQLTGDHIVPLSEGGTNDAANYDTLCGRCNTAKGGRNRRR